MDPVHTLLVGDLSWAQLQYSDVRRMSTTDTISRRLNRPLFMNEREFSRSSCMAGSSDMISPFSSYLFQQLHEGHLKLRVLIGIGTAERQKKH